MEKVLPKVGFEPGPSAYEENSLGVALLVEIFFRTLKCSPRVLECAFKLTCTVYLVLDVVKYVVV